MTTDRLRTLPLRRFEPRCARSSWRTVGLLVTAPLVMFATGMAVVPMGEHMRSPAVPSAIVAGTIVSAWMWTFSRRGPFERLRVRRAIQRVRRRRHDPWTADHRWDPRGAKPVKRAGLRPSGCVWMFVPWAIVVTLAWVPTVMTIALGLALLTWVCAPWLGFDGGRPSVAFVRFPYFPGEQIELHFGMGDGGATFLRARYVLRRIREVEGRWIHGGPQRTATFSAEWRPPEGVVPGPESDVRLLFDVPADAGGTSLTAALPSYWELLVAGETTEGWFEETFLIPVYERPAAAAAA